jgi:hypothetical protein
MLITHCVSLKVNQNFPKNKIILRIKKIFSLDILINKNEFVNALCAY